MQVLLIDGEAGVGVGINVVVRVAAMVVGSGGAGVVAARLLGGGEDGVRGVAVLDNRFARVQGIAWARLRVRGTCCGGLRAPATRYTTAKHCANLDAMAALCPAALESARRIQLHKWCTYTACRCRMSDVPGPRNRRTTICNRRTTDDRSG